MTGTSEVQRLRKDQEWKTLHAMVQRWPQCFYSDGQRRRPLKIGIAKEIFATGDFDARVLARVMGFYCRNVGYLRACTAGALRIGLDGEPAGEVSPEQAQLARTWLRQRKEKAKAAKAQKALKAKSSPAVPIVPLPRTPGRRPVLTLRLRKQA